MWVDASAGVAGDMLLGALLDAGASLDDVRAAVLAVAGAAVTVSVEPVSRAGLRATRVVVTAEADPPARTWRDVRNLVRDAALDEPVRQAALDAFGRLAEAEGRVHGVKPDAVHFHEVGALDAIADVIGVCAAWHALGGPRVAVSSVAVGSGSVRTAHGLLPVPVPAVVELLRGAPTSAVGDGELATPTGAALLAGLSTGWGGQPPMRVAAQGVGAGERDPAERPNVVRVLVGESAVSLTDAEDAVVLETNVDDLDPRLWPGVVSALLAAGAVDAWLVPVLMKKGRPAHTLSVLAPPEAAAAVRTVVFRETTAIGLRESTVRKHALDRSEVVVEVDGQAVRVKVARLGDEVVNVQPEWDDVAAAAAALRKPAKLVLARAVAAAAALQ